MNIVILGLSITSSWGNGHATTYRALVKGLAARGHDVLFLERDATWYADNRDLPAPPYCTVRLYGAPQDLEHQHAADIEEADLVIVGSYVPEGAAVIDIVLRTARGCTAFYDIDTPVTLKAVRRGTAEYLLRRQIPAFDLYLSFTGGPTLDRLEREFHANHARPLYCAVDPHVYYPEQGEIAYDLGYLGTYSADRQPALQTLLIDPASVWRDGRFVIAGAQYPDSLHVPDNVERIVHLAPSHHRRFYNRLRFTLNLTRRDMVKAGYSPSVRLFEAAACGTPIISDQWAGLGAFFTPGEEILLVSTGADVLACLRDLPEADRLALGARARTRVLEAHTSRHRAMELERYVGDVRRRAAQPLEARVG
jgi:spore maturation protein CgeB